jgi:hypothetical protein
VKPLFRELLRAGRLAESPVMRPILDRVGLPEPRLGHWGVDWVEPEGALYRPAAEGGRVAAIFPVDEEGQMIDLCAVSLETRAVRRRRGLGLLLGHARLEYAHRFGRPLTVFADPIDWLLGERRGVAVLDWANVDWHLADIPALACADEALALKLTRALGAHDGRVPPIFVSSPSKESPDVRTIHPAAARLRALRRSDGGLARDRPDAA